MRADWVALQESLKGVGEAITERQRQKQAISELILSAIIKREIEQQDPYKQAMAKLLNKIMLNQENNGQVNQFGNLGDVVPELTLGTSGPSITFKPSPQTQLIQKVKEKKQLTLAEGIPNAEIGKAALAQESVKNIQDVKNILFPEGTAQSYRRKTAAWSNLPLSGLPLIPSNLGGYNPQTIFRKVGAALSGRQLIQTGVAARPEETAKLVRQYAPSGLMSSQSALEGLNELENFYKTYLNLLQTKGIEEADNWARSTNKSPQKKEGKIGKYTFSIEE
jgi:hypothetical protein